MLAKSQVSRPGSLAALLIGWVAAFGFQSTAGAHDPGLSGSVVQISDDRIVSHDSFSWKDIDGLVRVDANGDGKVEDAELLAKSPELEALGAQMFSWQVNGSSLTRVSTTATIGSDENRDLIFTSIYLRPGNSEPAALAISFGGLDRLSSGHRHVLEVQNEQGEAISRDLLGRDHRATIVEMGAPDSHRAGAAAASKATAAPFTTFPRFVFLGAEHIVTGYDHLLFLVAIVLACQSFRTLVICITVFTVAHSLTLILATLGVIRVSPDIVEPIIAASIVTVALLHLFAPGLNRYLPALTFAFGLIHGLGFAGSIAPVMAAGTGGRSGLIISLAGFNLGVELGQLLIVLLLVPLLHLAERRSAWFRIRLEPAGCVAIALLGAYWMVERIFL